MNVLEKTQDSSEHKYSCHISYGIILITIHKQVPLFFVVKHMYTYSYSEFILNISNIKIPQLVTKLTSREVEQLLTSNFTELYNDLIVDPSIKKGKPVEYLEQLFVNNINTYRPLLEKM